MISIFPLYLLLVLSVDKKGFFLFHFMEVYSEFFALLSILSFVWWGGAFGPHMQEKHLFNCFLPLKEF